MAREFILKDYYNLNYRQLLYLLFYIGKGLVIINCSVLLSSRLLGQLFARKKRGGGVEILQGLFFSLLADVYFKDLFS